MHSYIVENIKPLNNGYWYAYIISRTKKEAMRKAKQLYEFEVGQADKLNLTLLA